MKLLATPFRTAGASVALSSDTRLIGAPLGGTGGVYVFVDDDEGAVVTFDQSDGDVLVYLSAAPAPATGRVTSEGAGVVSLEITFVNELTGETTTSAASLGCTPDGTSCSWHVDPRLLPGRFRMSAVAEDVVGNVTKTSGPSVFLIGTGERPV